MEATGSLRNFRTQAQIGGTDEVTAFHAAVAELLSRLNGWEKPAPIRHVLALHASQRSHVQHPGPVGAGEGRSSVGPRRAGDLPPQRHHRRLQRVQLYRLSPLRRAGQLLYGGPMVEEVYPAVRRCDALVMLCANYNDALSANLTACVNRLTALFRQTRIYDKRLFGLIVSGYSGGDLLARQLISALNMNKLSSRPTVPTRTTLVPLRSRSLSSPSASASSPPI